MRSSIDNAASCHGIASSAGASTNTGASLAPLDTEHPLPRRRRIFGHHLPKHLSPDPLRRALPAADDDVIPLHHLLPHRHLRRDQPDVPDVMLRARMMAAGQMNVHWLIQV